MLLTQKPKYSVAKVELGRNMVSKISVRDRSDVIQYDRPYQSLKRIQSTTWSRAHKMVTGRFMKLFLQILPKNNVSVSQFL